MMRIRCWFYFVMNGYRMTNRSVWGRDVLVRRLRCLAVIIGLVPEW